MNKEVYIPELDMSAFKKVGSTNLTNWQAVNELIANSIDSWILNNDREKLEISIDLNPAIDLSESEIIVTDNASGMSKEDIIRCFNLFYSYKSKEKMSDKILGFFGFGFKGATSKLGSDITIISSQSTKTYHQIKANYKLLEDGKEKGITYAEFKHDSKSRKLFNGGYTGTKIIIKDLNTPVAEEVLLYYLPISWKKYLNINEFGSPVHITLNNTKIIPPSFNLIDETVYDLNYDFSWKENGINHTGKAKGYVGLRFDSMSMSTQGINLYRRGQLIKPFEHSLYMAKGVAKHNDFNYLVGELDVELSATTTKTGFNVDSPGWEAFIATSKKELKPVVDQIKNKLKNRGLELSSSREKKESFIASYRKDLSLDLSSKQKNELKKLEQKIKNDVPKVVINEDKDVSLIVYDWNSFKINKQKIFIDFKSIPQRLEGNKLYEVIQIADSKINIIYDKNHELGEVLAKAVKNANKNDYAILIIRSIICDAIRQTYRSKLSPRKLVDLQNQLMGHPLD